MVQNLYHQLNLILLKKIAITKSNTIKNKKKSTITNLNIIKIKKSIK